MTFPPGLPVIDTMIGFPHEGFAQYDFIRRQTKDRESREEMEFPVEYMFKDVPKDLPTDDPIAVTLGEMDQYGIERGLVGVVRRDLAGRAQGATRTGSSRPARSDPNDVIGSVRAIRREFEEYGIRATSVFPAGTFPQVPIDDPKMYPIYQTCVDLGIPDLRAAPASPGPRLKFAPPGSRADRHGHVRLPRAGLRHPARLRALGGARRQADAQVAEPVLLDLGLRARSTTRRRSSTTPTPAAPTRSSTPATSRWACPWSASSRDMPQRAVQGRGLAEVPARERPPRAQAGFPVDLADPADTPQAQERHGHRAHRGSGRAGRVRGQVRGPARPRVGHPPGVREPGPGRPPGLVGCPGPAGPAGAAPARPASAATRPGCSSWRSRSRRRRALLPGPLLPTVLTSALVSPAGRGPGCATTCWPAFAAGATGACATTADGLTAAAADRRRVAGHRDERTDPRRRRPRRRCRSAPRGPGRQRLVRRRRRTSGPPSRDSAATAST